MESAKSPPGGANPSHQPRLAQGCEGHPTLYAPLLPGPVRIEVGGATGLLALEDDAMRLGMLHGALAGLAYPAIPGTVGEFVANCGPDASLTGEARTAESLRGRTRWIEAMDRQATDPGDGATVLRELAEARRQADAATSAVDAVAREHALWHDAFFRTSGLARRLARLIRAMACLAFAYGMAGGVASFVLWGAAAFLTVGISSRLAFRRVFDREAAYGIRAPLYAERTRGTGLRAADMRASGLLVG